MRCDSVSCVTMIIVRQCLLRVYDLEEFIELTREVVLLRMQQPAIHSQTLLREKVEQRMRKVPPTDENELKTDWFVP